MYSWRRFLVDKESQNRATNLDEWISRFIREHSLGGMKGA